jgi:drug/metabolite transporter (DMT)-like permease
MKEFSKNRVYTLLGIGVTVISFSGILIKLSTAPPLIIAFYRMLLSSLILTPYLIKNYRKELKHFFDYRPAVVGLFLATHFFLWFTAFQYTNVASAVIFIALQPLFTLLLEYLFAREDLREGVIVGLILALLGSVIISIGDFRVLFDKLWGDLLAIAAAFFAAVYIFSGRSLRKEIDYFPYIYIVYSYTTLILGFFVLIFRIPLVGYDKINYLYFLGLALGPTLIGHSAFNYSVRFLPATIVSLAILGEPVLTTLFAWLLIGEKITLMTLIGGVFIIGGIYRAIISTRKKNRGNN